MIVFFDLMMFDLVWVYSYKAKMNDIFATHNFKLLEEDRVLNY
jgi:hypothetical protein